MKNDRCSTQKAITLTRWSLSNGADRDLIKNALCIDGFTADKADVIIRWADQFNKADDDEYETAEPNL